MSSSSPTYLRYWGKARPGDDANVTWHPAAYHMLDVAAVGIDLLRQDERLADRLAQLSGLNTTAVERWLFLCLALHDLGKFFPAFQRKAPSLYEAAFGRDAFGGVDSRHDVDGLLYWKEGLRENKVLLTSVCLSADHAPRPAFRAFEPWITAALCHHGRPQSCNQMTLRSRLSNRQEIDIADYITDVIKLAESIGAPAKEAPAIPQTHASWLVAGLSVLCDWLGSNMTWFPYNAHKLTLSDYWYMQALPNARDAIRDSCILASQPACQLSIADLLPATALPSPLQEAVQALDTGEGPALVIVEDQTGAGKTEAALALAGRMMTKGQGDGLFIALPTMATANAMYRRCESHYRHLFAPGTNPTIVLAHAKRDLVLNEPKLAATDSTSDAAGSAGSAGRSWISDDRRKSSLADCGIGTVDQAVMAVLPSFYQSLRLAGLARKVLVLDEVHAHDSYLGGLVAGLLRFHAALGGSAVLLSATLPAEHKRRYARAFAEGAGFAATEIAGPGDAYPQITLVNRTQAQRVAVAPRPGLGRSVAVERLDDEQALIERIVSAAKAGQAVAWIRNTVADAISASNQLRQHIPVHLFHARFAMGDRLAIEERIEALFGKNSAHEQRQGQVLVATQVAEQSLDIDFDLMVSDLAPMDALIQRAGRLWRHTRPERQGQPKLLLASPDPMGEIDAKWYARLFPKAAYVYQDPLILWRTARHLVGRGALVLPEQARQLIETAYCDDAADAPPALLAQHLNAQGKGWGDRATANAHLLDPGKPYGERSAVWDDEMRVPTRLGEPQSQLRLARWADGVLSPWCPGNDAKAWRLSEVTVMRSYVDAEAPPETPALRQAIESAKNSWPGPTDAALLIALSPEGEAWTGTALNGQGKLATLRYHPETGLEFERKSV